MEKYKIYMVLVLAEAFLRAVMSGDKNDPLNFKEEALRIFLAREIIEKTLKPNIVKNLRGYIAKHITKLQPNVMDYKHVFALTLNYLVFVEIVLAEPQYSKAHQLVTTTKHNLIAKSAFGITAEMLRETEAEADMYISQLLKAI